MMISEGRVLKGFITLYVMRALHDINYREVFAEYNNIYLYKIY